MNKRKINEYLIFLQIILNIAGIASIFLAIWFIYYRYNLETMFLYKKGTAGLIFIYSIIYFMFCKIYNGYGIGHIRLSELIYSQGISAAFSNFIIWIVICLIDRRFAPIKPIMIMTAVNFIYIFAWSYYSNKSFAKRNVAKKTIIIYDGEEPADLIRKMKCYQYKFRIISMVKAGETFEEIKPILKKRYGVVLCGVNSEISGKITKFCFENSMPLYIIPNSSDIILKGASTVNLLDTPLFLCSNDGIALLDSFFKRCFDVAVSILACALFSPIMLITALFIKAEDGGPVIFKQERLTLNGKRFFVYKFRSMITDAEKDGKAKLAMRNDSRITKIGKFIRLTRIDELPQLFNILKGDMSIVGPRPERPEIAEEYEKSIPEFKYRLKVKAGLTGYAQVLGRYNTKPYDKLMWDMTYIENYSFYLDIKLILMTIKILFMPESSEGFSTENAKNPFVENNFKG